MRCCPGHLLLCLALSAPAGLLADEPGDASAGLSLNTAPAPLPAPASTPQPITFEEDSWSMQITGNYLADLSNRDVQLVGGGVGVNYYLDDGISLGVEVTGYHLDQSDGQGVAGGLGFLLRQHFIRRENWSLYVDVGESLFEADRNVPRDGTHFNFLFHAGPGLTWKLSDRVHLMAGVRYFHISNAQTQGGDRNPACNGIEGYVGLMLPL